MKSQFKHFLSAYLCVVLVFGLLSVFPQTITTKAATTENIKLSTDVNAWDGGYSMNVNLTSVASAEISNWILKVPVSSLNDISSIWCASYTKSGDNFIFTPAEWNQTISAKGSASFGFNGLGAVNKNFSYELTYSMNGKTYTQKNGSVSTSTPVPTVSSTPTPTPSATTSTTPSKTPSTTPSKTPSATPTASAVTYETTRGVVAVRTGKNVFISWRFLNSDSSKTSFNIYRSSNNGSYKKLNSSLITKGTNYTDTSVNVSQYNTYYVTSVINKKEVSKSETYTLKSNAIDGPVVVIPIRKGSTIKNVWTADFNNDGKLDFLVDRRDTTQQTIEAYLNDGTFLWTACLGPNSENKNNLVPGSATIDVGHWDGATVSDMDNDGKAEVLLKVANGVTFGDGKKFTASDNNKQSVAVLDGMTGHCKATSAIPSNFIKAGPLGAQFGIGYLDGRKPSLVIVCKNRNANKSFNMLIAAYSYTNGKFNMDWKWLRDDGKVYCPDGHHMRIADVDYDGKDEILEIGFCLNGNGTLRYSLASQGVIHGDRFYVGKFNKNDSVMMGYGIQQSNPNGLQEYYYNASTGKIIWKHTSSVIGDVGRGNVGDFDPTTDGWESYAFNGIFNMNKNALVSNAGKTMWPAYRLFWDGDLLSEQFNDGKIEKWNYNSKSVQRLLTCSKIHDASNDGGAYVIHYGDILGDWREEVVCRNSDNSELVIFTTNIASDYRFSWLMQDPCYRNCMTVKGYKQSHTLSYYLGSDMFN